MGDRVANIAGSLVVIAGITTVVIHPASAQVIKALGDAFRGAIQAAIGK